MYNNKTFLQVIGVRREFSSVDLCFTITYHPAPMGHPSMGGELPQPDLKRFVGMREAKRRSSAIVRHVQGMQKRLQARCL